MPGGPGPARSGDRAAAKGHRGTAGKWQYLHDIGFVYYWHVRDYEAAAIVVSARARATERAELAASRSRPSMLTTGNDRASARFLWQQMLQSDEEWLRRNAERTSRCSSTRWTCIDQLAGRHQALPAAGRRAGDSWEALVRRARLRGIPTRSGGHAVRARSGDRTRPACRRPRPLQPMPNLDRRRPSMTDDDARLVAIGDPRPGGRQLSQRLHPSPAARRFDRPAGVALPALRLRRCAGSTTSRSSATCCSRGRCRKCRAGDLDSLPDRRARDDGDLRRALSGVRVRHHPGAAPGLCVRADRALRHRPRAPSAAERHHAPGHRRRAWLFSTDAPSGHRRRARSASSPEAVSCG